MAPVLLPLEIPPPFSDEANNSLGITAREWDKHISFPLELKMSI